MSASDQQKMIRQLAWLVDVSVTLNSTLDPNELLQYIIQKAAELLDCEAASILLFDERRGELYFTAATGSDVSELVDIPVPLEGSLAGTIFRENRPLVNNNVATDPRHFGQVGEQVRFKPRSLLGVPMCIRERVTGVLEALNKRGGDFDEMDVRLLSVIASQAAVAIQNARLVQALQQAYAELSRIDKIKSDFLAVASHELRTPLGLILGYATFLKEDAQGELSSHANAVLHSALRMQGLIEAMTNMNLLQMGAARLSWQTVSLQAILQLAFEEVRPAADSRSQTIVQVLPPETLSVEADPEKLQLVFNNLLNNALRFSPPNSSVTVTVADQKNSVRVEVVDQGIGIPPAELKNIFKEFYQVEGHLTRQYDGLGLGLAIARSIVELHAGEIWAESQGPGKGAAFIVILPKKIGTGERSGAARAA